MHTELNQMPRPRLEKLIARADKEASDICTALIADGRGHCRYTDLIKMDDALALRYRANSDTLRQLRDEAEYRKRYHGTLLPVRRRA